MSAATLDAAYARCQRMAREHYENFPVASYLLPSSMRPHIAAIYAFARTADDFADEPGMTDADRLRHLDRYSSSHAAASIRERASAGDATRTGERRFTCVGD